MRLIRELRSHIQYKIILPFLILTLLVALAGSAVSFVFVVGSAQERLNNQLAQVARAAADTVASLERANLQFLREMTFAGPNPANNAPAIADALAENDISGLERAVDPYFLVSTQREGVRADRLIVFNTDGQAVLDWERIREGEANTRRVAYSGGDINGLWFVSSILAGRQDALGDKNAGLLDLGSSASRYLFSVAPVVKDTRIVGGIIVATRFDTLLQNLRDKSSSAIVAVYQADNGNTFASTQRPDAGLAAMNVRPTLLESARDVTIAEQQGIFDTVNVNEREYQFAYAPLRVRENTIGIISVALARDYVTGPWADMRGPLLALTIALMLTIIGLGIFIARQITHPLQELVSTAQAVTSGDLGRRSQVKATDEVGILSHSFNEMTEHLIDLYDAVHIEASKRAAIVESIADGVVVCDPDGRVLVMNRAMRVLLGLSEGQAGPHHFEDVPLQPLEETVMAFGDDRTPDLFRLRDYIVRIIAAPVLSDEQARLGDVYVLQNLTSEVAIDQAKTNFIATISHELRTPLTVLGGSSELLLRGLAGQINDEQRTLIESMRKHTLSMTALLNNVITIAGLESGTLVIELEPTRLHDVLDEVLWGYRPALSAKGLDLSVSMPDSLPEVLADSAQLRNVLNQLLDNARRYTQAGTISISASQQGDCVRVDISDTGPGISPELCERLFSRFSRGSDGINSNERGMGLGLTIAKLLIERQGGAIWLEQTSDCGSTFSFTLTCIHADPRYSNTVLATAA
jgi:signal transduction histidine kinase